MVCIKDAYPGRSEPAENIIYSDISPKCGKYRTIFALQKSPKVILHL